MPSIQVHCHWKTCTCDFNSFCSNLLCLQVYVPGVLACSSHVEKGDKVAVSVAVEQPVKDSGWAVGITRGTVLQGLQSGKPSFGLNF